LVGRYFFICFFITGITSAEKMTKILSGISKISGVIYENTTENSDGDFSDWCTAAFSYYNFSEYYHY
jgi:hypothetical protein